MYQTLSLLLSALLVSYMDGQSYISFVLGSAQGILFGSEAYWSVLEIFVPLTGRLGMESPAENIIAVIVSLLTFMSWPLLPSYVASMSRRAKLNAIWSLLGATTLGVLILGSREVWDAAHPRRLFVQYLYNATDSSTSLHFASADSAPGFKSYLDDLAMRLDLGIVLENHVTEWVSDWDTIYPFSQFLDSYRIDLPTPIIQELPDTYSDPTIIGSSTPITTYENGTKIVEVNIACDHPGLIWTVISFDAEIIEWDLPMPDSGMQRHHIKQVSTYGSTSHEMGMTIRVHNESVMWIDFIGVEELGMYPAMKDNVKAMERDSMNLFKKLEGHRGVGDAVDMCSNGVVAGRYRIDLP